MWLQALLTRDDIAMALTELTPLRVELEEGSLDRYLWLAAPSSVACVPELGIRVRTRARLQWDVVGIPVPVSVEHVVLMITPSVRQAAGQDTLHMQLRVEELDLSVMPTVLETAVIERINASLSKPGAALEWSFMKTLDFSFKMPSSLQPVDTMRLHARWGAVRVSDEGLSLAVAFGLKVNRDENYPDHGPPSFLPTQEAGISAQQEAPQQ